MIGPEVSLDLRNLPLLVRRSRSRITLQAANEIFQSGLRSGDAMLPNQREGVKTESLMISLEPFDQLCVDRLPLFLPQT